MKEQVVINLKNKSVVLTLTPYEEIDVDDLTSIHHHNLIGEMLTISVALNRVGNMVAECNELVRTAKLDFDIFWAQMWEEKKKELTKETIDSKGNIKEKLPTIAEVENAIIRSPEYKVKKMNLIESEKNYELLDSVYRALWAKSKKLEILTQGLKPEEFENEIVEGVVNGILIKTVEKPIKD